MAKLIAVIEVETARGSGTKGDPHRTVYQYYATDGTLLAERDDWLARVTRDAGADGDRRAA